MEADEDEGHRVILYPYDPTIQVGKFDLICTQQISIFLYLVASFWFAAFHVLYGHVYKVL